MDAPARDAAEPPPHAGRDALFDVAERRMRQSTGQRLARLSPWIAAYLLYVVFHILASPFLGIRSLIRAKKRDYMDVLWTRLTGGSKPPRKARWTIVIAGGLGEKRAGYAFAERIHEYRDQDIAVCVQRADASRIEHARIHSGILPFNNPISVLIFLLRWRPKAMIAVEFWDNHHLLALSSIFGVKTLIINVPITHKATREITPQSRWRFKFVGAYCCQGKIHRLRMLKAGVDEEALVLTGPVGIAVDPVQGLELAPEQVRAKYEGEFCLTPENFPVIVAGSTYRPDEGACLDAFAKVRAKYPHAVLMLAPRNLNRPSALDAEMEERTISFTRRSQPIEALPDSGVFLIDKVGELKYLYSVGHIAYVGGTMGRQGSGHTPVEANAWYLPITLGPDFPQQKIIMDMLIKRGIAFVCNGADELAEVWLRLAESDAERAQIAHATRALFGSQDEMILRIYDCLCL